MVIRGNCYNNNSKYAPVYSNRYKANNNIVRQSKFVSNKAHFVHNLISIEYAFLGHSCVEGSAESPVT